MRKVRRGSLKTKGSLLLGCGLFRVLVICRLLTILAVHLFAEARPLGVLVGSGGGVEVTILRRLCDEPLKLLLHRLLLCLGVEAAADWQESGHRSAQARLLGRRRLLAEVVGAIVTIRNVLDGIGQVHLVLLVLASASGGTAIVRLHQSFCSILRIVCRLLVSLVTLLGIGLHISLDLQLEQIGIPFFNV